METLDSLINDANERLVENNSNNKGEISVADLKDYKELYHKAKEMKIGEALQLIREAESEEEKSFYAHILNLHFQQKQKMAIERNLF